MQLILTAVERLFTPDERWSGGHYELEMELGPRSDERLVAALRAVWAHPALEGPYADRKREPSEQPLADPVSGLDEHFAGVATLPDGSRVPCATVSSRLAPEQAGGIHQEDSLNLYLPVAGLAAVWPHIGRFPFPEPADENDPEFPFPDNWRRVDDRPWQEGLEEWFAGIGRSVFEHSRFRVGLVGFEIYVSDYEWTEWVAGGVPREHALGVLWPGSHDVEWHPSTMWGRYEPGWGDERPPVNDVAP
jgi:hypothetical protein